MINPSKLWHGSNRKKNKDKKRERKTKKKTKKITKTAFHGIPRK